MKGCSAPPYRMRSLGLEFKQHRRLSFSMYKNAELQTYDMYKVLKEQLLVSLVWLCMRCSLLPSKVMYLVSSTCLILQQ